MSNNFQVLSQEVYRLRSALLNAGIRIEKMRPFALSHTEFERVLDTAPRWVFDPNDPAPGGRIKIYGISFVPSTSLED